MPRAYGNKFYFWYSLKGKIDLLIKKYKIMKNATLLVFLLFVFAVWSFAQQVGTNPAPGANAKPNAQLNITGETTNTPAVTLQGGITGDYIMKTLYPGHLKNRSRTMHFAWSGGNPNDSTWIIYFNAATLNDLSLGQGDEIAIFYVDGLDTIIVGARTLTAEPTPFNFQQYLIAFNGLMNGEQGYIPGNEFKLVCWDSKDNVESQAFDVDFSNPFGDAYVPVGNTFPPAYQQYSLAEVSFDVVTCPEDFEVCCNEDPILLNQGMLPGGLYSGDYVSQIGDDYYFNPDCTDIDDFIITYTKIFNGNPYSCNFTITVLLAPVIEECPSFDPVCTGSAYIPFLPVNNGVYTDIDGIVVYGFDPVNSGDFTFTLTVSNDWCEEECQFTINVSQSATVNIFPDDTTLCTDQVMDFAGIVKAYNYDLIEWAVVSGTGDFNDGNILEPVYYPSINDFSLEYVLLQIEVSPEEPCIYSASDQITIYFEDAPVVNAGADLTVCEGFNSGIQLSEASAGNVSSLFWTTDGSGSFDNNTIENPTYYPGISDFGQTLQLCIVGNPVTPCEEVVSDCLNLSLGIFPDPTCPEINPVCEGAEYIEFPIVTDGEYTDAAGNVVLGLDPIAAGTYTFTLMVSNEFGCTATCEFSIVVDPLPVVTCPADIAVCCDADEITLSGASPVGGIYYIDGIPETSFTPDCANPGDFIITYFYTDQGTGCENSCDFTITVNLLPVVNCPADIAVCCDADEIPLSGASPAGGIYYLEGTPVTSFTPDCANIGDFLITYLYTDPGTGCENSCEFTITVNPIPLVNAGEDATIFAGETYPLANASALHYSSLTWSSFGDGSFSDTSTLNTVYTPGEDDIISGSVELCLTAHALEGCTDVVDCITLTIDSVTPVPVVNVLPGCLRLTLMQGEVFDREIKIENDGYNDLTFELSEEVSWLTLDTVSGSIPGNSFELINAHFDAAGLSIDDHFADITIGTNDPDNLEIIIPVTLSVVDIIIGQSVHVVSGWSIISSYIHPTEPQLEVIFENQLACSTMVIMINDNNGVFWPSQTINLIGEWDSFEAYKVKMAVDDQLLFYGEPVEDMDVSVVLNPGLNFLPVLSSCPVSAPDVFNDYLDEIRYVFDIQDNLVFWPGGGLNTLQWLLPGRGYLIFVTETITITFPECGKQIIPLPNVNEIKPLPFSTYKTGSQHIVSIHKDALACFKPGDLIVAKDNDGHIVGVSRIDNMNQNLALIIYGDDFLTSEKDGMYQDEFYTLSLYAEGTMEFTDLDVVFDQTLPDNSPLFNENGLSRILKLGSSTNAVSENNIEHELMIFPNPARDEVTVMLGDLNLDDLVLRIYSVDGQVVKTYSILEKKSTINIDELPSGIYILGITTNGQRINKRLIKY